MDKAEICHVCGIGTIERSKSGDALNVWEFGCDGQSVPLHIKCAGAWLVANAGRFLVFVNERNS